MNRAEAEERALAAAGTLFYTKGIHAVGMHDIRDASGVSLKRLYQCFPSKDALVAAYLNHGHANQLAELRDYAAAAADDPRGGILALFDSLEAWFKEADFRGCAYINAYGELGGTEPWVAEVVRDHKAAVRAFLKDLLRGLPVQDTERLSAQIQMLIDGAMVSAALHNEPRAARRARDVAEQLLGSNESS